MIGAVPVCGRSTLGAGGYLVRTAFDRTACYCTDASQVVCRPGQFRTRRGSGSRSGSGSRGLRRAVAADRAKAPEVDPACEKLLTRKELTDLLEF